MERLVIGRYAVGPHQHEKIWPVIRRASGGLEGDPLLNDPAAHLGLDFVTS
jgi:hypothetical protein